ncbi:FAD-dependent oxidoreductase, partial [Candidatus Aerophobetes bacterium]|nr:FAD-dependent oxidoreductase [Candidatus Aerophobetes bacterium]
MIDLTIDDESLKVEEGTTILQAAEAAGIKIPTLCYHKALSWYGACRICLVEISMNGSSQIQASCQYQVQPGMVVRTDSERVIRTRKIMVELLLARCPNSKKIRELADELGIRETRFPKRDEDCLLCGLCVRMCHERMGRSTIGFAKRGIAREVVPPFEERSEVCLGCGSCEFVCPTEGIKPEEICKKEIRPIASEFDEELSQRSVIHIPFPQAIPNKAVVDRENCVHFLTEKCEVCKEFCEADAIDFGQKEQSLNLDVGAVILAPGFEEFDATLKGKFGYGVYPNVVSSIEFERILSASGPYKGKVLRPSDQRHPKRIAFIQCVGSRDPSCNRGYCSSVCCMYATKEAIIAKEHDREVEPTIFFMDLRAFGKDFDKYYERAQKEYGIRYVRSMISAVKQMQQNKNLKLKYINDGREIVEEEFDLVVLSVGLIPSEKIQQLGRTLGLKLNKYGFCETQDFASVKTSKDGIYVCGAFQGPKDIPETVIKASGAASFVQGDLASVRGRLVTKKEYPPEIDVRAQPPRIGAFICHCGI